MRRREVIALLGFSAFRPITVQAEEQGRRLAVLGTTNESDPEWEAERAALLEALRNAGWTEGKDLRVDYRLANGDPARLAAFAKELVSLQPDVLLARSTLAVGTLVAETRTIPIVFVSVSDPVGAGFAENLARPAGNITGFTNHEASLAGKWLELAKQISPQVRRVGLLFNPTAATQAGSRPLSLPQIETTAVRLLLKTEMIPIRTVADLAESVAAFTQEPGGALLALPDAFIVAHRGSIIDLAARYRLPAIYPFRNMALEGGLVSYGVDVADLYRRSASYIDRILRGEAPGELPIQTPTKFELVLNLKTAAALGLTVPPWVLARADEVIE